MAGRGDIFGGRRWRGRWVWFEAPRLEAGSALPIPVPALADTRARTGLLRRRFHLDHPPGSVPARVTADSRYALWVNGVEVSRGPVRDHPTRLHFDSLDLAPFLTPGDNVIAALVRFYGRANAWWMPAVPALQLGAGAFVFEARLDDDHWIVSDRSWKAMALDGWECLETGGIGAGHAERIDGRAMPAGWADPAFDDTEWNPAVELEAYALGFQGAHEPPSAIYGALLPRPIPLLSRNERRARVTAVASARESRQRSSSPADRVVALLGRARAVQAAPNSAAPVVLEVRGSGTHLVSFDFGEVVCGTLVLEVDAPAGTEIDVVGSEFPLAPGSNPSGPKLGEEHRAGMRCVTREGHNRFETFDPLGVRYAVVALRAKGEVRLHPLAVVERLCPRGEGPFFECSDDRLNRIWRAGRRTVDLCTLDAYVDCPTREQRAWTGDAVVHQMVDLCSNTDWRAATWCVELAARPRADGMLPMAAACDIAARDAAVIPDWALHWIHALHNVYRYTGDRDLVARHMAVAENVLRWFDDYRSPDGLLWDVTGWVLIDWAAVTVGRCSAVLNALWGRALREFAEMSAWLDDSARAAWARECYERVRVAFETFWDARRGRYADAVTGDSRAVAASVHAQAAAAVAGFVPVERRLRILELLTRRELHVQAAWSAPGSDPSAAAPPEGGIGGPYLFFGTPEPWWDVEDRLVAAQPFFRYVVHDALAALGAADRVADACTEWEALLQRAPTFSETWYGGTTCHGWSSTPTRDLLWYTLGVTPAEPGFELARVAPRLGPLSWARGAVPTPLGLLRVEASRAAVSIESPVPFDLYLEDGSRHRFSVGRHDVELAADGSRRAARSDTHGGRERR